MKYIDATNYHLLTVEAVRDRARAVHDNTEAVVLPTDLLLDATLCSDDQFLELFCNVLIIH